MEDWGVPRRSQCLGIGSFNCGGPGLIPGRGTKIPQAMQHGQKIKLIKMEDGT